jgi:hypothetical protein
MVQNVKLPIDAAMVKALMNEKGLRYKDIEAMSNGTITEISLKHFLNKGTMVDENTLDTLTTILDCSKNDLVSKEYILSLNLSFEINRIMGNLYLKERENINNNYALEIRKFKENTDLRTMLNESHRLFITLLSDEYIFDKSVFVKAFKIIGTDFIRNKCICNRQLTCIQDKEADNLYSKIIAASGDYNTQQIILMFLYVFILFDAIFLEEAVASALQLVPKRRTDKADQYLTLTYRSVKMRDALINLILYKGAEIENLRIIEMEIDDIIIDGISIMLAACEKCYLHINSVFLDSEYVNRASLSAILTHLEKIFDTIDIKLPQDNSLTEYINMNTSRFGILYNSLKNIFNTLNPPRKSKHIEFDNYWKSINPMTIIDNYCELINRFFNNK